MEICSCSCPDKTACEKAGRHLGTGRLWQIWNNQVLTPEKCEQYRRRWMALAKTGGPDHAGTFRAVDLGRRLPLEKKPCNCGNGPRK